MEDGPGLTCESEVWLGIAGCVATISGDISAVPGIRALAGANGEIVPSGWTMTCIGTGISILFTSGWPVVFVGLPKAGGGAKVPSAPARSLRKLLERGAAGTPP